LGGVVQETLVHGSGLHARVVELHPNWHVVLAVV
jgi:hypothetical protein